MVYYRECPDCGCSLDPGERCDCRNEREKKEDEVIEYIKIGARGQYRLNFDRLERGYREKAAI